MIKIRLSGKVVSKARVYSFIESKYDFHNIYHCYNLKKNCFFS